jgi:hypothetical protein
MVVLCLIAGLAFLTVGLLALFQKTDASITLKKAGIGMSIVGGWSDLRVRFLSLLVDI